MRFKKRVVEVLEGLQLKNGGILATPKDAAYPFIYPRDAVFVTKAYNRLGLHRRSERFYYFLLEHARIDKSGEVFHRYNSAGLPCVTRKGENDNTALVVHGIYDTYAHSRSTEFIELLWPFVTMCMRFLMSRSRSGLLSTERSIHESYRLEHGYEIWANCSACRALFDAAKIAKELHHEKEEMLWRAKGEQLQRNIRMRMFNRKTGVFMKSTRYPEVLDSSVLSPFYFGIEDSKRILRKTMSELRKHLWNKEVGGFRRFRQFEICKDWHWYTGGSGSWLVFTLWGARFYKELGDRKHYMECVAWVDDVLKRTKGLLPEHVATKREYRLWMDNEVEFNERVLNGMKNTERMFLKVKNGTAYWATPLGWSHAEYVLNCMEHSSCR